MTPERKRALVAHVVGRALLQEGAAVLARAGIPLMPLKGIWLQHRVYEDPAERLITDVDVLVPEEAYEHALAALVAAGFRLRGSNVSETNLVAPHLPMPIDVHKRLFTRGAFSMPTAELFSRGTPDSELFGSAVVLPDPRDVFAHLIGHFVKSRGDRSASLQLHDFAHMGKRLELDPKALAAHLDRCGVGRAARYTLELAAAQEADSFCRAVLAMLDTDPLGALLASAMRRLRDRAPMDSGWAALPGFVLDRSLPSAARTVLLRMRDRRHDWGTP